MTVVHGIGWLLWPFLHDLELLWRLVCNPIFLSVVGCVFTIIYLVILIISFDRTDGGDFYNPTRGKRMLWGIIVVGLWSLGHFVK